MPFVREDNNHPVSFDNQGNLTDQVTLEKGMLQLPLIIIKGFDRSESKFRTWLRNTINSFLNKKDSYYNANKPYQFDTLKAWITGEFDNFQNSKDRLLMLGLTKENNKYYYKNPYYKELNKDLLSVYDFIGSDKSLKYKKELQGCAANANKINSMLKKPTSGHAWTRHGIYGDSAIIVNPYINKNSFPWYTFGKAHLKANYINNQNSKYVEENIDKHNLKTGDIIDIGYSSSHYSDRALKEGDYNRANTHTGTLLKIGTDKRDTYVIHYMGDGIRVDPIGDLLKHKNGLSITGIRRPGTKTHQYK